jgi:hypothetical protein
MGSLCGRGLTTISTWGFCRATCSRWLRMYERIFDDVGQVSQYSKISFRIWGMKASRPFDGEERKAARKIGTVGGRRDMGAGGCGYVAALERRIAVDQFCLPSDSIRHSTRRGARIASSIPVALPVSYTHGPCYSFHRPTTPRFRKTFRLFLPSPQACFQEAEMNLHRRKR